MRAVAPARSGNVCASSFCVSSQGCERYFSMGGTLRDEASAAGGLPQAGEEVVLGNGGVDQRPGQDVVVVGVGIGRDAEPEGRGGVDLGGVGEEGSVAHVVLGEDVDARGDAVVH